MAQDHYIWCTDEFGILDIGGEVAISSSIMPQKKNPVSLELVKAKAAHGISGLISGLSVLKNTPFSLCMDLFETATFYWEAHAHVMQGVGLMTEVIKYSKINKEHATEKARQNFCTVTALADCLVRSCGISFSQAHNILGSMVAQVYDDRTYMEGMTSERLKKISEEVLGRQLTLSDEEIHRELDPRENVNSKTSIGCPHPDAVESMLTEGERRIRDNEAWLNREMDRVENAYKRISEEQKKIS
jgi:argininosuccinate lyase